MRKCSTCQHTKRAEIDRRLAAGEPGSQIARDYDLNPSSLHRHRTNCLKLGSSNAIMKDTARGTAAVALLPSKGTLGGAYLDLRNRIDEIVKQANSTVRWRWQFPVSTRSAIRSTVCRGWPATTGQQVRRSTLPCKPTSMSKRGRSLSASSNTLTTSRT